jgi:hypothetical protein
MSGLCTRGSIREGQAKNDGPFRDVGWAVLVWLWAQWWGVVGEKRGCGLAHRGLLEKMTPHAPPTALPRQPVRVWCDMSVVSGGKAGAYVRSRGVVVGTKGMPTKNEGSSSLSSFA